MIVRKSAAKRLLDLQENGYLLHEASGMSELVVGYCNNCVSRILEDDAEEEKRVNLSRTSPEIDDEKADLGFGGTAKTGMSFTLPQGKGIGTCPGETDFCKGKEDGVPGCYGDNLKGYKMPQSRERKYKNFRAALQLLKEDPSGAALGQELAGMIKYSGTSTMRIHDLGDFFTPGYVRAWIYAIQKNPKVDFWAYTRSYVVPSIFGELKNLAALPNMSLWLSADRFNYKDALKCYDEGKGVFAGVSMVQTSEETRNIAREIQNHVGKDHFINFLVHGNGGHVYAAPDLDLVNCPGPMKDYIEQELSKEQTKAKNAEKKGRPYVPGRDIATDQTVLDDIEKFLNPGGTDKIPPKCLACRGCIVSNPREFGDDLLALQNKHAPNPDKSREPNEAKICRCPKAVQLLSLAEAEPSRFDRNMLKALGIKAPDDWQEHSHFDDVDRMKSAFQAPSAKEGVHSAETHGLDASGAKLGNLQVVPNDPHQMVSKDDLKSYLSQKWKGLLDPREMDDDMEIAIYWFANHYHTGQASDLYSIASTSPYRPGPMTSFESEDETIIDMYYDLVARFGD